MNNEILRTLDALAISTFVDLAKQSEKNNSGGTEDFYKSAVRAAETNFGPLHGEVGLVLIGLSAYYRRHGRYEEATLVDKRIADITSVYAHDLEN